MRGKRSKVYRKLMNQFSLNFGFREPYQVLVDAQMVEDCGKFTMDLAPALKRTLHGTVKPMITQCCIRRLYASKNSAAIAVAKTFEKRLCGHHELEQPLSTMDCFKAVVDSKTNKTNKHRYIVASQDGQLRAYMRQIPGIPLIYVSRSVMVLEPMSEASDRVRLTGEKGKFRLGFTDTRGPKRKRKRGDDDKDDAVVAAATAAADTTTESAVVDRKSKRRKRGPKGPNPLSVKKTKRREVTIPVIENSAG